jgi:hypothetical protein
MRKGNPRVNRGFIIRRATLDQCNPDGRLLTWPCPHIRPNLRRRQHSHIHPSRDTPNLFALDEAMVDGTQHLLSSAGHAWHCDGLPVNSGFAGRQSHHQTHQANLASTKLDHKLVANLEVAA